jgi:hypothetical protein
MNKLFRFISVILILYSCTSKPEKQTYPTEVQRNFKLAMIQMYVEGGALDINLKNAADHMGADVILSPSSWAVPPDHDNAKEPYGDIWNQVYEPVAKEFKMWIIGVSNVGLVTDGPWKNWNCIGCSLVINPNG